jgi:hypothetical protein
MRRPGTAALALVALVACAWFVIGIRQTHQLTVASAIVSGPQPLSAARAAHAASLLRSAGWLNPDSEVDLARAKLFVDQRRYAAARHVIDGVLADEPQNAAAWLALAHSSHGDPNAFYTAVIELRKLVPRPVR